MSSSRRRKGTVGVESDRGWLRLRMPRSHQPRYIYLNLPDEPQFRKIANELAQKEQDKLFQQQWGEIGLDFLLPQSRIGTPRLGKH